MKWNRKDLERLQAKGLKTDLKKQPPAPKASVKISKPSIEKLFIEATLKELRRLGFIKGYECEHRFDKVRRFRFDWALPDLKIAIEYEGIFSKKSRHTTATGFTEDCSKYNLAASQGWRVLRYTAKNYKNIESDLKKLTEGLE